MANKKKTSILTTLSLILMSAVICFAQGKINLSEYYSQTQEGFVTKKLIRISKSLIGSPYSEFPLGEGKNAKLISKPIYRLDKFDCLTYVETVLALSLSKTKENFEKIYSDLKYSSEEKDFFHRNHFTSVDWNYFNQRKGYLTDITATIKDKNGETIAAVATTLIDKPSWYRKMATTNKLWQRYAGRNLTRTDKAELQNLMRKAKLQISHLSYIPISKLRDDQNQIDLSILQQLPDISIVEIVRENWHTKKILGTELDVSHIGFLIKNKDKFTLRHAHQGDRVVDVDFSKYLEITSKQTSFAGINIQKVNLAQNIG